MFRTIFTKSLREYRWAILGWGIGLGLVVYSQYATYGQLYGGAKGAADLQQLAQQFRFVGDPIALNTPGGYATFRAMGLVAVFLGIWTVLAGARMTRGEEERGALDIPLSTPHSRTRVLVEKTLALAAATGLIAVLITLWILAGMTSAKVAVDPAGALLEGLNVALAAFLFGMLALLLAQFMGQGAAAGWAGGLMAFLYVLDGAGRAANTSGGDPAHLAGLLFSAEQAAGRHLWDELGRAGAPARARRARLRSRAAALRPARHRPNGAG